MEEGTKENRQMKADERFMRLALEEARRAAAEGEVPIGAVVVLDGAVISSAHNRRELDHDPSAHAEFRAMTEAAQKLGRWRLSGCTVYVTLEPCLMCAGLMVNSRIDRCVYGAADPKGGALGTLFDVSHDARLNHEFAVTSGVLEDECASVLREFFQARRAARKAARRSGTSGSPDSGCQASPRGSDGPEPAA
ncbi:MAG: tRNA adenosine(34) deaminase TadA [Coriobacteriaceae bacterium]|jgi:tRNA(adenine34) deaminase|nr:MAG: tRNA adenosine(34) deaminase TadA [Coriobacteriaceae bacterium]